MSEIVQFDVILVGNALIDAFLNIRDASLHSTYHEKECEICFKLGEKIQLDSCDFVLGGNACNVAVGLSRLEKKTALVAEIGSDEFSFKIINGLSKERVDLTMLKQSEGAASSFAIGINFKGERTLFVEHVKRSHEFNLGGTKAQLVYLTSLGEEWRGAYTTVLNYVEKNNCRLAFNPGTPQIKAGVEGIMEVMKRSDILFVNKEEAEKISIRQQADKFPISNENEQNGNIKQLLSSVQELGPKVVVITDGKNGSYLIDEQGKIIQMGVLPVEIIEKTGAGDAFTSGFLGAHMSGLPLEECLNWGTINAASVVGKVGAQAGLLTKEEMLKRAEQ